MKNWFYWHISNPIWYCYHGKALPILMGYKPFKKLGIYIPLLNIKWWTRQQK